MTSTVSDASQDREPSPKQPQTLWQRIREITDSYAFKVIVQGLITIWLASTFTFFLIRFLPGNPLEIKIEQLMNQGFTYEQAYNTATGLFRYDPNRPLFEQYVEYIVALARGDLGNSIVSPSTKVSDQIARFLPWTIFSIGTALFISFTVGVLIGMAMAYWRGSWFDNLMTAIGSLLSGVPDYVFAFMIVLIFGLQLGWFNVGELRGGVSSDIEPGVTFAYLYDVLKHAMLPIITYVLSTVGVWMLSMKSSTISTLGEDYINVAKARGLSERRILTAYVGRNAMLPLVTRLAISIGFVLSGSVIVERFFEYPGLGRALIRAINQRDYTVMQGIFLTITAGVILSNILADLMLGILDPRVSLDDD